MSYGVEAETGRAVNGIEMSGRSGETCSPFFGISGGVEDAIDRHCPCGVFVENRVGESTDDTATIISENLRVDLRGTADRLDAGIDTAEEFFSQADSATFVPAVGFLDILLRFRCDYEFSGHNDSAPVV
jgi:hypothetical protein